MTRRWTALAAVVWIAAIGVVVAVGGGGPLPIDLPSDPTWSIVERLTSAHVIALEVACLTAVVAWATRENHPPTAALVARGPTRQVARRELVGFAAYLVVVQGMGALIDRLTGVGALSYHLMGSIHGTHHHVGPQTVAAWVVFNTVAYVAIPGAYLLRRHSPTQLWLRSSDRRRDALVVVGVLVVESAFQLLVFGAAFFALTPTQIAAGSVLTLAVSFLGTVLPTLVIVAVVVVPRVLVLTGSQGAAVVVGGLTYAALHAFDGWTSYASLEGSALSVGLLVLQYFVPGMFKSFLTLRTGNAWVHAWAYHAIAPHVWADTPLIVRVLGLK